MMDLQALYQEVIIDHSKNPRNFHECEKASHHADGYNPLCGDKLKLYLVINNEHIIEDASFVGEGCAISTASASLMTDAIKGKSISEANQLFQKFHCLVTNETDNAIEHDDLGKLECLAGVRTFPMRVKCATLAWHTLKAALSNEKIATTE